ncbi:sugar ABC transporter substrate-binding protein [Longispora sp. NPDC051575]|uniref:ABC transporter substrate-binding protein n=1 Tax=Longispora sp. NPDC051575 TaxID=3154943 RepID=UPI00342E75C7
MTLTRRHTLSLTALGLLGAAAGCASGSPKKSTKQATEGKELTGTVTVWSWDVAATALKRLGPEFTAKHPKVKIEITDIGYDNAYDKITIGLKSGSGLADVLTVETDHMQTYAAQFPTGFLDLTSVASSMKADFDPSKWAASSDKDGKLFSLPWDSGTAALFYRTDLFATAGIDPKSIATWDDLITAGKTILARTGAKLLVSDVSNGAGPVPTLMQQQGAGYFNAAGDITLDSPATLAAIDIVKRLNDAGLILNVKGWDALVSANKDGKVACAPSGVWWAGTLATEMPELSGKLGVMPLPAVTAGGGRTANNGGSTLAVPGQSKNPDAAWAFVRFCLADVANQVSMMKAEGLFPAYLPALRDPYFDAPQKFFGDAPIYQMFREQTSKIPTITYTDDYAKAGDLLDSVVPGVLLRGKDPKSELKSAAAQLAGQTKRKLA